MNEPVCKRCGQTVENGVTYKCVRCFTEYCVRCENSQEGRVCPKCGVSPRMVLDAAEPGARK